MARVCGDVVTVDRLACVWLDNSSFNCQCKSGFAVSFEARACSDVTIQLAPTIGGSHYSYDQGPSNSPRRGYTVVFGSHNNTRFRVVGSGETSVDKTASNHAEGGTDRVKFQKYWLNVCDDTLKVGTGSFSKATILAEIKEEGLMDSARHLALSAWDQPVSYKDVAMKEPIASLQTPRPESSVEREMSDTLVEEETASELGISAFLGKELLADVMLVCLDGEVAAHMIVLACFSKRCADMMRNPRDKMNQIQVAASIDTVFLVLQLLYCAEVLVEARHIQPLWDVANELEIAALQRQLQVASADIEKLNGRLSLVISDESSALHCFEDSSSTADVSFNVEGEMKYAHRCILAANSPIFYRMFTTGFKENFASISAPINVDGVSSQSFGQLLHFLYAKELPPSQGVCETLPDLMYLADKYTFSKLQTELVELSALICSPENAIPLFTHALMYESLLQLRENIAKYIAQHLEDILPVCPAEHWNLLSADGLWEVLRNPWLYAREEMVLFRLLTRWVSAGEERVNDAEDMLGDLKLPLLNIEEASCSVLAIKSARVREMLAEASVIWKQLVHEDAESAFAVVDQHSGALLQRLEGISYDFVRRNNMVTDLVYQEDFDSNGVCHCLGTHYGTRPFVNPTALNVVKVDCSGVPSRHLASKNSIVGRRRCKDHRPCFASPTRGTDSWWSLELMRHRLACNYYSIGHDSSDNYIRSWVLEASDDGETWTVLRRHIHDESISSPGQYASFPVQGEARLRSFTKFRISLTGKTTSQENPYRMSLAHFELYGILTMIPDGQK
mmetsp:Transcript_11148/g.40867  ORF Transcript_11148/g.40867 Transcript_11148/m.40867 type:complete len:792 (+) Transcript_11148:252-2627(+)